MVSGLGTHQKDDFMNIPMPYATTSLPSPVSYQVASPTVFTGTLKKSLVDNYILIFPYEKFLSKASS